MLQRVDYTENTTVRSFEAYKVQKEERDIEAEYLGREHRADVHQYGLRLARHITIDIAKSIRVARVEQKRSWNEIGKLFAALWEDQPVTDYTLFGMLICKYAAATTGESFRSGTWNDS